jgi:cell division protein FtsL
MNNVAYDLSIFEPLKPEDIKKAKERREKNLERIEYRKNKASVAKVVAIVLCVATTFFSLCAIKILGKVEINKLMRQQDKIVSETNILEAENVRLRSEIKARTSYNSVVEFAEEIGMIKVESSQITYINTAPQEDCIVISGDKTLKK